MPPRAGLTPGRVVGAALAVVDDSGADALTLAAVAGRTGVAAPSLYKHVDGLAALRRLVKLRVLAELGEALRTATLGRSGPDALRALATAYRDYLRAHPRRHPFVEIAPVPAPAGAGDADAEVRAATDRVVEVAYAAVRGFGLSGPDAVHAIRCVRSAVHGFASLEAIGGFGLPEQVDVTFDLLLDMVVHGVSRIAQADRAGAPLLRAPAPPIKGESA